MSPDDWLIAVYALAAGIFMIVVFENPLLPG